MAHGVIVVASGRLLNLGCATGHHSFLMPRSSANLAVVQLDLFRYCQDFPNQVLAPPCSAEVLDGTTAYKNVVYRSPKQLDGKIATSHLPALSAHSPSLPRNMQIRHVSRYMKQMKNAFNESSLRDGEVMMLSALYVAVSACPHGDMGRLAHESLSFTFVLSDDIHGHSSLTLPPYRHEGPFQGANGIFWDFLELELYTLRLCSGLSSRPPKMIRDQCRSTQLSLSSLCCFE